MTFTGFKTTDLYTGLCDFRIVFSSFETYKLCVKGCEHRASIGKRRRRDIHATLNTAENKLPRCMGTQKGKKKFDNLQEIIILSRRVESPKQTRVLSEPWPFACLSSVMMMAKGGGGGGERDPIVAAAL